jgi:hypothetical protein
VTGSSGKDLKPWVGSLPTAFYLCGACIESLHFLAGLPDRLVYERKKVKSEACGESSR